MYKVNVEKIPDYVSNIVFHFEAKEIYSCFNSLFLKFKRETTIAHIWPAD